jgi:hypothetical protein
MTHRPFLKTRFAPCRRQGSGESACFVLVDRVFRNALPNRQGQQIGLSGTLQRLPGIGLSGFQERATGLSGTGLSGFQERFIGFSGTHRNAKDFESK